MNRWQPIYDIASICYQRGLQQAVICPGSRCAPLTLAFSRHSKIQTRTFSDERSAAFIALGIAQQTSLPAIMVCTSGSAAYNFAPAVAEAYLQHVPLLVFTADRPAEWIDQLDGQTIHQNNIFGNHVKKSFELPQDYSHPDSHWHINRIVNEAITLSLEFPQGPIHINAPFREPLYPLKGESINFSEDVRIIENTPLHVSLADKDQVEEQLRNFTKILIVAGQGQPSDNLSKALEKFSKAHDAPVIGDIISNTHGLQQTLRHADVFLGQADESVKKSLQPELIISFGQSVISKNLKTFLRKYKPKEHWHIQTSGVAADTFQSLTKNIQTTPACFFDQIESHHETPPFEKQRRENFFHLWQAEEHRTIRSSKTFFSKTDLGELHVIHAVMQALPKRCNLHLANSMTVRYANFIGLEAEKKGVRVFSNRGTSGIDGCTSTAVGHALTSEVPNILITGDMAFFYDRNAFWHNYKLPNLRVLIINNHGGVIFGMIDGPGNLEESNEYFITQQKLKARNLAEEYNFVYTQLDNIRKLKNAIKDFFEFDGNTKVLELESSVTRAKESFEEFKNTIRKEYEAK